MKKLNTKGFSAVEVLLVILIVAVLGGIGYMVYNNRNKAATKTETTTQKSTTKVAETAKPVDPTASWKTADSLGGAFSMKVPDGWELNNYTNNYLNGNSITYTAGKPATITAISSAFAGDQRKFNVVVSATQGTAPQWESPNNSGKETTTDYSIGNLKGKKYTLEFTVSDEGVTKGDKVYQYVFNLSNGKQLDVVYKQDAGDADNLKVVEQAISTIVIK